MTTNPTVVAANTNTPCAACKAQRRKCTSDCVFAPYFPPDNPQKFNFVHRVFGASNVSKLLVELPPENREDAVNSLAYEAEARLRDPVYGCVGLISVLQQRLRQLQSDLKIAKSDLSQYIGPSAAAMFPYFPPLPPSFAGRPGQPLPPFPPLRSRADHPHPPPPPPQPHSTPHYLHLHQQHQQQQQMIAEEQYAAVMAAASMAREQEEMIRIGIEQHKFHQQAMMRSSSSSPSLALANISNNNDGFINAQNIFDSTDLALGTFGDASYHINQQQPQPHQTQEFNQQMQEQFIIQIETPQPHMELQPEPQAHQQYQLRLGILRKLEDEDESSNLLGHNNNNNDDGPSTY